MIQKNSYPLKSILNDFAQVVNALADTNLDYDNDPVDEHTFWDDLPHNTVRSVYSTDGPDGPSRITSSFNQHNAGLVVDFGTGVGGDYQIFIGNNQMAVRQVGNPSGWNYLNPNEDVRVDDLTTDTLNNLLNNTKLHRYMAADEDEDVTGEYNFEALPTYNGDPLVYHREFGKAVGYIRNNLHTINKLRHKIKDNYHLIYGLSSEMNNDEQYAQNNFMSKEALNNYVTNNMLNDYATKDDLDNLASNDFVEGKLASYATKDDLSDKASNSDLEDLEQRIQSNLQDIQRNFTDIQNAVPRGDFDALKRLVHRIDRRTGDTQSAVASLTANVPSTSQVASLSSQAQSATNLMYAVSGSDQNGLNAVNSAVKDNQSKVTSGLSAVSSLSSAIQQLSNSDNSEVLNSVKSINTSLANISTDNQKVLATNNANLNKLKDAFHRNSLSQSNMSNEVSSLASSAILNSASVADVSNGVSLNASRLNSNDSKVYDVVQHSKRADKRNTDAIGSLSNANVSQNAQLADHTNSITALNNSMATVYGHLPSGISMNASMINVDGNTLSQVKNAVTDLNARETNLSNMVSQASEVSATKTSVASLSNGISLNASMINSDVTTIYNIKHAIHRGDVRDINAAHSLSSVNSSHASEISSVSDNITSLSSGARTYFDQAEYDGSSQASVLQSEINNVPNGSKLSNALSGISANATRINSADNDTWRIKQNLKKSNKRYTDAIKSLADKSVTGANTTSLSGKVSALSANVGIDVNSLATKITSIANTNAESKISSVVTSDKAKFASQSTTNTSLSSALKATASSANSIDSALTSALSKNQLK